MSGHNDESEDYLFKFGDTDDVYVVTPDEKARREQEEVDAFALLIGDVSSLSDEQLEALPLLLGLGELAPHVRKKLYEMVSELPDHKKKIIHTDTKKYVDMARDDQASLRAELGKNVIDAEAGHIQGEGLQQLAAATVENVDDELAQLVAEAKQAATATDVYGFIRQRYATDPWLGNLQRQIDNGKDLTATQHDGVLRLMQMLEDDEPAA